jgi:Zn-finger nucleic acid-binding protein
MARLCPDCATPMRQQSCFDILLDTCDRCGGIWFDQGEMGRLMRCERTALLNVDEQVIPKIERREGISSRRVCPDCMEPLDRYQYLHTSPVELDYCPRCGGVWVDDRELANIQSWLDEGRTILLNSPEKREEMAMAAAQFQMDRDKAMQRAQQIRAMCTFLSRHPFGGWRRVL